MPLSMFIMGVRSILKKEAAYVFYMHPWEIDAGQPKVEGVNYRLDPGKLAASKSQAEIDYGTDERGAESAGGN
jgi:hypothetical protein